MTDVSERPVHEGGEIWVKPSASVPSLGGLIATNIHETGEVTLRAIGAGANNQAIKAIVHARQLLAAGSYDLIMRPGMRSEKGKLGDPVTVTVMRCSLL